MTSFKHRTALLLLAPALALTAPSHAAAQTTEHTLSVTGTGEVELAPDQGAFSLSVTRRAQSAADARSRANRRIAAIIAGVRSAGILRNRITTDDISIARVRHRVGKHGPIRVSYRARAGLSIGATDLKTLGKAIDAASDRGATQVYGPDLSFSPALQQQGAADAEKRALQTARTRADTAAANTGQAIVGVQSIDLDPDQSQLYDSGGSNSFARAPSSDQSAPTTIIAGLQTFTAVVRVTYIIQPA